MERITATDASRNFKRVLDRAEFDRETFVVERNGKPVAEIRPAQTRSTVADLVRFLHENPLPDPDFADDVRSVIEESRRDVPRDRWGDR